MREQLGNKMMVHRPLR